MPRLYSSLEIRWQRFKPPSRWWILLIRDLKAGQERSSRIAPYNCMGGNHIALLCLSGYAPGYPRSVP